MRMQLAARVAATTLTCLAVAAGAPVAAAANTNDATAAKPTFYKEVLPILQENCQECHRTAGTSYGGQLAPMGLETYEEVGRWDNAIAMQV